ncbi:NAD(P)-binding protein [Hymenopellis radicata]|nr:NAD(P)-binding protein [Hymenopellis radicata]
MAKTVLITGCSDGGLGAALAMEYHLRGHKVFATSRTLKSMETLASHGIQTFVLDVTLSTSLTEFKTTISGLTGGRLDILVNNAGMSVYPASFSDISSSQLRGLFDVNVFGVVELTQTFLPLLLEAKGTVVLVGSIAALLPIPFNGAYNMSKAALLSYGNTLRVEMSPFGVKVMTLSSSSQIMSGLVQSRLSTHHGTVPQNSLYYPIRPEVERDLENDGSPVMLSEAWAKDVVAETLRVPTKLKAHFWIGPRTWIIWFVDSFLPRTIFDFGFIKRFSLRKLQRLP